MKRGIEDIRRHILVNKFGQVYPSSGGREVFVWSDCLLDLGTDFLVGNTVFV